MLAYLLAMLADWLQLQVWAFRDARILVGHARGLAAGRFFVMLAYL